MNRRGASLLVAMATVMALGLLGAIALSGARLERITARQSLGSAAAAWAAQAGLARVLDDWHALGPESLPVGGNMGAGVTTLTPTAASVDSIRRLGRSLYEIVMSGERRDADAMVIARETQAVLVMLVRSASPDSAAAWISGPVRMGGLARVSGLDQVPAGWDSLCPSPALPGPGILAQAGSTVDTSGCGGPGCLGGQPPVAGDTAGAGPAHLAHLRSLWPAVDTLVGNTVTGVGPLAQGGVCSSSAGLNWGAPEDPVHPCFDHFRLVGVRSGTVIQSGTGQGILLGEGDLVLDGDFRFYGVVAASGSVVLRGRSEVVGTVLAGRSASDSLLVMDQAGIARSACAVRRALARTVRPVVLGVRGWSGDP